MAKFCGKCGSKLDAATGLCPNCNCDADALKRPNEVVANTADNRSDKEAEQQEHSNKPLSQNAKKSQKKATNKAKKKDKRAGMTTGKKIRRFFVKFILLIVLLSIIAVGIAFSLVYFNIYEVPVVTEIMHIYGTIGAQDDLLADNLDELEEINLGEETRAKSQVLDTIDAAESNQTTSEADTAAMFEDRGFDSTEVIAMYSMDGTYLENQTIDENGENHHPLYSFMYLSPNDYLWMVYCCNGEFFAYPISYILSDMATCEVLISETEYVMSYDSDTNCFYKIIPNDDDCIIKEVSRIDSDMLDMLAAGELGV